jgi:DNA polymerase III epsilon subunit-like protein
MNMHTRSASLAEEVSIQVDDAAAAESPPLYEDPWLPPVFIFCDTETTGFRPTDEIVEICLMRVPMERSFEDHFEQLTVKLCPVSNTEFPHATAVHGLSYTENLQNCVTFQGAADTIFSFICDSINGGRTTILVTHNVHFDRRMISDELARIGWTFPSELQFACTLEMMRTARATGRLKVETCKLSTIYEHVMGCAMDGAHGAFKDTLGLLQILQTLKRDRPEWQGDACPFRELAVQAAGRAYSEGSTGY